MEPKKRIRTDTNGTAAAVAVAELDKLRHTNLAHGQESHANDHNEEHKDHLHQG
jgi:hypothetical protein